MYGSTDPLVFPPHFPPTTRREKFFIGVRGLGPDLSFFKQLKKQQGERTPEQMKVWGSGKRREIAEQLALGFKKEVRWPTAVFLPADSFEVMCNGPAFGMLDDREPGPDERRRGLVVTTEPGLEERKRDVGSCHGGQAVSRAPRNPPVSQPSGGQVVLCPDFTDSEPIESP